MATRTRRSKPAFTIRTVATKEDRRRPSVFMRLKTDEAFKGYALFEPDPELADNPGYFEYYDHYDKQGNAYVPCTGENCPFCAANDNPSTRALTAWYFPQAADVKDQIKVFTMNFSTTQEMSDEAEDEGGVLGKMVRVKRLSDKGDYRVKITTDKPLTKAQIKEALKNLEEKFKDGLPGLVMRQLEVQMERLKALDAMDDDDDEDEEREERSTKARRGRATSKVEEDDDEDDEDEDEDEDEEQDVAAIEEEEFTLVSVSKAKNSVSVEHDGEKIELVGDEDEIDVSGWKKGDTAIISAEYDEDEEGWVLTTLSEAESEDDDDEDEDSDESEDEDEDGDEEEGDDDEDEDEDEDSTAIEGGLYEVVRVEEADEILHLKNDAGRVKMWVGDGVNPDYDEVKKGAQVKIDAQQDEEGDWIVMSVELAPKARTTRKSTTAAKTTTRSRTTRSTRKQA